MLTYRNSGNVTIDNVQFNQYLYDGEGRICAALSPTGLGGFAMTGYIYDAEGRRVAKGTITSWTCDITLNGFTTTTDYILGQGAKP
jgi:hypothetical protein